MKRGVLVILAACFLLMERVEAQVIYRWMDESGTIHFTDDPTSIPEKYRKLTEERKASPETSTSPSRLSSDTRPQGVVSPSGRAVPSPSPTDQLGRGELWWRSKMKEWNERLETVQRHYEEARAALEGKTRELEGAKLKPDSFQRRLKAERKSLEEKVDHWERQIKEAREMLERTLPQEARDYGADPAWLKPPE